MEILPNTNYRECDAATCLAFAVAVKQGQKKLSNCPHLGDDVLGQFQVEADMVDQGAEDFLRILEDRRAKASSTS